MPPRTSSRIARATGRAIRFAPVEDEAYRAELGPALVESADA
ncbi:hypothetical protein [Streptomyces sp. NPDC055036]